MPFISMRSARGSAVGLLSLMPSPVDAQRQSSPRLVISEIMADPAAVSDQRGEWIELHNPARQAVDLRGYSIASGGDAGHVIRRRLVIAPGGYALLGRDGDRRTNGGVAVDYAYGAAVSLANGADWLALRDRSGTTIDSVAWRSASRGVSWGVRDPSAEHARVDESSWQRATTIYGRRDRGTPGRPNDGSAVQRQPSDLAMESRTDSASGIAADPDSGVAPLVVRVLDVGQGDAIYVANGTSKVLIDGGPETNRLGQLLDSLALNNTTIDVVVLSHQHYDHFGGLRELFRSSRRIRVRFFFENQDASPGVALAELRDSVIARAERGELVYRDTDDPCGDGRPLCTISMRGGAKLHVMRPARTGTANNRSTPLKIVGPDSASFTMWLAGDAEHDALRWFDTGADYDSRPGMRVNALKADHHGSCNGVSSRYLRLTNPDWVIVSVGAVNEYGHMHAQAKETYSALGRQWYRTDENGTITIRSPGTRGGGYRVEVSRGVSSANGRSDRRSRQEACSPMP